MLLLFGALFCWALGTSIGKKLDLPENVITSSGIQMLWVGLAGLLIAVLQGHNAALLFSASIKSLIGLGGLLVFGSTGFIAYTWLVKNEPAIRVSSSALVNPVVAVLVGLFIGRETPAVLLLPGCICILCGITFMLYGEKIIAAKK
ncbi:MAG TPA: hypothetical protein DC049_10300 [Spirochaetia bacterium]|nr:hypothetical protein [Spirochaetia bacterium]